MTVILAAAVALAVAYLTGYLTAWWRLHRRVARLATLADRLRADVAEQRDRDRHAARTWRDSQIARIDTYYLAQRRERAA